MSNDTDTPLNIRDNASKISRFRQLLAEKQARDAASDSPPSAYSTNSAPSPFIGKLDKVDDDLSPRRQTKQQSGLSNDTIVRTWPPHAASKSLSTTLKSDKGGKDGTEAMPLDLNRDLESEREQGQIDIPETNADELTKNSNSKNQPTNKENSHPNNYAAMRRIMKAKKERGKALVTNALKTVLEVPDSAESKSLKADENHDDGDVGKGNDGHFANENGNENKTLEDTYFTCRNNTSQSSDNLHDDTTSMLDDRDASAISAWAMMGPHLNETAIEDGSIVSGVSNFSMSPARPELYKKSGNFGGGVKKTPGKYSSVPAQTRKDDLIDDKLSSEQLGAEILSFMCSPLFHGTPISQGGEFEEFSCDESNIDKHGGELNSPKSDQSNRCHGRFEDSFIVKMDEILSPVLAQADNYVDDEPEKEVTFAIDGGWDTPGYQKVKDDVNPAEDLNTPSKRDNNLNESVLISDDEASVGNGKVSESILCQAGSPASYNKMDTPDSSDHVSEHNEEVLSGFSHKQHRLSSRGKSSSRRSPTKESLMERNKTLVKEVRFADQTCVELAEKNKYHKSEAARLKKDLASANREISNLRCNNESTLQENAKLKAIIELFQSQKREMENQVESCRMQISATEENHRESIKKLEETYQSHLQNSEKQVNSLHDLLRQSSAENTSLRAKMDEFHAKWESKHEEDITSRELISSLKEQIASQEIVVSKSDSTINAMQARIDDLQSLCQKQQNELQRERNECRMIEEDRDDLQTQCEALHKQLTDWAETSGFLSDLIIDDNGSQSEEVAHELNVTPIQYRRNDTKTYPFTPTSNLLARTLRSELKLRHKTAEELEKAEEKVEILQKQVSELKIDLEEAKADSAYVEDLLEEKDAFISELEEKLNEVNNRSVELELKLKEQIKLGSNETHNNDHAQDVTQSTIVREMQETIEDLEERVDIFKGNLADAEEEILRTRQEQSDTERQLKRVSDELEDARAHLASLALKQDENLETIDKQSRKISATQDKLEQSENVNNELKIQLGSCLKSLVALEKILRSYEDADDIAKEKWTEYSRRISRLVEALHIVQECFSPKTTFDSLSLSNGSTASGSRFDTVIQSIVSWQSREDDSYDEFNSHVNSGCDSSSTAASIEELREVVSASDEYVLEMKNLRKDRDDANEKLFKALRHLQDFKDVIANQESELAEQALSFQYHINSTEMEKRKMVEANEKDRRVLIEECRHLEQKLSKVSTDLESKTKEDSHRISGLKRDIYEISKENEILQVKLESCMIQLEQEKESLRATDEVTARLRSELQLSNEQLKNLQEQYESATASLEKYKEETRKLKVDIDHKESEIDEYRDNFSSLQETLAQEKSRFEHEKKSLEEEALHLELKVAELEIERDEAESNLDDASKHVALLENISKLKDKECAVLKEECGELQRKFEIAEAEIKSTRKEILGINDKYNAAQELEIRHSSLIEELKKETETKQRTVSSKEKALAEAHNEIRRLKNDIARFKRTILEQDETYNSTMKEKNSHINELERSQRDHQSEYEKQLRALEQNHRRRTSDLEEIIEKLQLEVKAINKAYQESGDRAKSIIAAKESALAETETKIEEFKSTISKLETELLKQNENQSHLEEDIIKRQGEIDTLQALFDEESEKFNAAASELEIARGEMASLSQNLQSLKAEHEQLVHQSSKTQQELESSLMDIERMKTKYQDDEATAHSKIAELQSEKDELVIKCKTAEESLGALVQERDKLFKKSSQLERQLLEAETVLEEKTNELANSSAQISKLQSKYSKLKILITQLNDKNRSWEQSNKVQIEENMKREEKYKAQNEDLYRYGLEISRLQGLVDSLKSELVSVRGSTERYRTRMDRINQLSVSSPHGTTHLLDKPNTL
ncbi:hypothetical protein ACHAXS_013851 [Conticribra weissflogii]